MDWIEIVTNLCLQLLTSRSEHGTMRGECGCILKAHHCLCILFNATSWKLELVVRTTISSFSTLSGWVVERVWKMKNRRSVFRALLKHVSSWKRSAFHAKIVFILRDLNSSWITMEAWTNLLEALQLLSQFLIRLHINSLLVLILVSEGDEGVLCRFLIRFEHRSERRDLLPEMKRLRKVKERLFKENEVLRDCNYLNYFLKMIENILLQIPLSSTYDWSVKHIVNPKSKFGKLLFICHLFPMIKICVPISETIVNFWTLVLRTVGTKILRFSQSDYPQRKKFQRKLKINKEINYLKVRSAPLHAEQVSQFVVLRREIIRIDCGRRGSTHLLDRPTESVEEFSSALGWLHHGGAVYKGRLSKKLSEIFSY